MSTSSRRNFLRIGIANAKIIRPPWAIDEDEFTDLCIRCDECINVCPEKVIVKGDGGFPQISFEDSGCELCKDCLEVCKPKALFKQSEHSLPWHHKIKVTEKCLPYQGVICRSCYESCDEDAIKFTLVAGKIAEPQVSLKNCNGCGFCVAICPVDAIQVYSELDGQQNK